ncbi:hypothetical protein PG996_003005 [Apiospora saccharicola]|uniref:Uncharacterized protein n=1 Tax=Apiospora saccharicola TaxID=335842 RepID=A0ABR1W2Y8_9PEZI
MWALVKGSINEGVTPDAQSTFLHAAPRVLTRNIGDFGGTGAQASTIAVTNALVHASGDAHRPFKRMFEWREEMKGVRSAEDAAQDEVDTGTD